MQPRLLGPHRLIGVAAVPRVGVQRGNGNVMMLTRLARVVVVSEEFKSYFASFGAVVEHQIMQDHSTGRSRGFGFVTFDSEQVVEDILAHGKMHELGGKQVSGADLVLHPVIRWRAPTSTLSTHFMTGTCKKLS